MPREHVVFRVARPSQTPGERAPRRRHPPSPGVNPTVLPCADPELDARCENSSVSTAQNSAGTARVIGRPFERGVSGNPSGRPRGLARTTRELVGDDGRALVELWLAIAQDPMQRTSDRLEATP